MGTTTMPKAPRSGQREGSGVSRLSGLLWQLLTVRGAGFGLTAVLVVLVPAAAPDLIAPYDPNTPQGAILLPPSREFWLGSDHLGRDVLSRVIHGARAAVRAGVVSVGFAV